MQKFQPKKGEVFTVVSFLSGSGPLMVRVKSVDKDGEHFRGKPVSGIVLDEKSETFRIENLTEIFTGDIARKAEFIGYMEFLLNKEKWAPAEHEPELPLDGPVAYVYDGCSDR